MNTKANLALAVLVGISIGAVSVMAVHAQEVKRRPPSDHGNRRNRPRRLSEVRRKGSGNACAFQGQLPLCRPWRQDSALEGQPPKSIVVLAFDSTEKALAWYNSPAYEAIKPIRQGASVSRMFMADGLPLQ